MKAIKNRGSLIEMNIRYSRHPPGPGLSESRNINYSAGCAAVESLDPGDLGTCPHIPNPDKKTRLPGLLDGEPV